MTNDSQAVKEGCSYLISGASSLADQDLSKALDRAADILQNAVPRKIERIDSKKAWDYGFDVPNGTYYGEITVDGKSCEMSAAPGVGIIVVAGDHEEFDFAELDLSSATEAMIEHLAKTLPTSLTLEGLKALGFSVERSN